MTTTLWTMPAAATTLGRVIDPTGAPLDGKGPLPVATNLPATANPARHGQQLETGIKVIDVFAPLAIGDVLGLFSHAGVGKMVLMSELIDRLARRYGGAAVFVGDEEHTHEVNDMMRTMREAGVDRHLAMVFPRSEDESALRVQALHAGWALAADLARDGRPVLLFIDRQMALAHPAAMRRPTDQPIIVIYFGEEEGQLTPGDAALGLDAQIILNPELGRQMIWPAADPRLSRSRLLEQGRVGAEHAALVKQARAAWADGAALAQRLLVFGAQPFYTAELYTGIPGAHVAPADAVRDYAALLAGACADAPLDSLRFIGRLPQ